MKLSRNLINTSCFPNLITGTIVQSDTSDFWHRKSNIGDFIPNLLLKPNQKSIYLPKIYICTLCQNRKLGNSTYIKVILTKNLTFIIQSFNLQQCLDFWENFQFCNVKVTEIFKKSHFFHISRNLRKLELCMVNSSDKSKVFC